MKKALSLALATACVTSCIVCPATAEEEMTGGEMLAMMFINNFFTPDEKAGINYSVSLDHENKRFIIKAQNKQLEELYKTDNADFEKLAVAIMELFDSVNGLMLTSTGDSEYYMTLTYYPCAITFDAYISAGYCCFSSKDGTTHRVNDQFITTDSMSFTVADEDVNPETVQAVIDWAKGKNITLRGISFSADGKEVFIGVLGDYGDILEKNYKGKTERIVCPDRYIIDGRALCNDLGLEEVHFSFYNADGHGFASAHYSRYSQYAYYWE